MDADAERFVAESTRAQHSGLVDMNVNLGVLKNIEPGDRVWVRLPAQPNQEQAAKVKRAVLNWIGFDTPIIVVGPEVEFAVEHQHSR